MNFVKLSSKLVLSTYIIVLVIEQLARYLPISLTDLLQSVFHFERATK